MIPLSVPNLVGNEKKYVCQALDEGWVSSAGRFVTDFERQTAAYVGSGNAVACQSGSAGLHLALRYVGAGPGDLVLAPTLTFLAPVNTIAYQGATPLLMDCDESLCLDPAKLADFLAEQCDPTPEGPRHRDTGRMVRALVLVHVFGNLCDMERILPLAQRYRLPVIEDATEALGTRYIAGPFAGRYAGTLGDIGVFSYNGNKIITTGGGGMIVTDDAAAAQKMRYWSTQAKDDELYYVHEEIGYNYRLTNVQAAMGVAQLECLEDFIQTKRDNYLAYRAFFEDLEQVSLLPFRADIRPNYWFYTLRMREGGARTRDALLRYLQERGIQTRPVWKLCHLQTPYLDAPRYRLDWAEANAGELLNIPCSSGLTPDQVAEVAAAVRGFFAG